MNHVIYLSHGGGPLPLLEKEMNKNMISYYQEYASKVNPSTIVVISAHNEKEEFEVIYDHQRELLYDYYGFPEESYTYEYNPPVHTDMGKKIVRLLKQNGLPSKSVKGKFDHGVFVPLMIMYPDASIPVIQISLKKGLDVAEHIALGNALSSLEDVLFVASGSSFHNLRAFFSNERYDHQRNEEFHDALKHLMTADMLEESRVQKMIHYQQLPHSSFVHPRSEHLIPLFVAYGIAQKKGMVQFDDLIMGKRCICVEWEM